MSRSWDYQRSSKVFQFNMVTFHDIWWYLVTFDDIWWYFMTKPCRLSWYVMIYHELSWHVTNQFREVYCFFKLVPRNNYFQSSPWQHWGEGLKAYASPLNPYRVPQRVTYPPPWVRSCKAALSCKEALSSATTGELIPYQINFGSLTPNILWHARSTPCMCFDLWF